MKMVNGRRLSVSDLAVHALERSDRALTLYDIARVVRRDLGAAVNQSSLQVSISNDRRFCWAGRGLYGLYRHGLVPGPRNLAGVARVFLFGHGPLRHEELEFVMKESGYRFQSTSLGQALNNEPEVWWFHDVGGWLWDTARTEEAALDLQRLGVARTREDFNTVVDRCAAMAAMGLAELERRLG